MKNTNKQTIVFPLVVSAGDYHDFSEIQFLFQMIGIKGVKVYEVAFDNSGVPRPYKAIVYINKKDRAFKNLERKLMKEFPEDR